MTFSKDNYKNKDRFHETHHVPPKKFSWPTWVFLWNIISLLLLAYDAAFVFLRPRSMSGGDLHKFFFPYDMYVEVDTSYADLADPFVVAQSCMNIFETVLHLWAIFQYMSNNRPQATCVEFAACSMTFSKTILYVAVEAATGFSRVTFNVPMRQAMLMWFLPLLPWILIPLLIMLKFGRQIIMSLHTKDTCSHQKTD